MRFLKTLLIIIISLLVLALSFAFVAHNQTLVSVDLLFMRLPEASLSTWLIVFFVAGGLVGLCVSSALILREKQARMRVEKRLRTTSKLITGHTS